MISEKRFSQRSASVWRLIAPALDIFVRRVNLELYERDDIPLVSQTLAYRRGFINELAFNIFTNATQQNIALSEAIAAAIKETRITIARIQKLNVDDIQMPSGSELEDASEQALRLRRFCRIKHSGQVIELHPRFNGCGIIDVCLGDFYADGWLYEVKAGDRKFRSADFRQLLIYAALNSEAKNRALAGVGLINPRLGTSFRTTLDSFCQEISGRPAPDLMSEIVHVISSGDTSR